MLRSTNAIASLASRTEGIQRINSNSSSAHHLFCRKSHATIWLVIASLEDIDDPWHIAVRRTIYHIGK